ncbi:MAG TPA: hypothetical protein VGI39_05630 [Polyangiaceae bacterium]|jgi:TolA-binding protein
MPRRGIDGGANAARAETFDGLIRLAREATTGEVSEAKHVAGRARFLTAVEEEAGHARSRFAMRSAMAMAAAVVLVAGGVGVQKWRAAGPEWTVDGKVASGEFVRAPTAASATIDFEDGSAVVLSGASRARVVHGDHHHVVLEGGKAEVRIGRGVQLAWAFDAGPFTVKASKGGLAMAWSGEGEQLDVWPHDAETVVQGGVVGAGVTLHGGDHLTARVREGDLRIVRADGGVTTAVAPPPPPPVTTNGAAAAPPATGTAPDAAPSAATPVSTPASPTTPAHTSWSALVARGDYDTVLREADGVGIDSVLAHRPLSDLAALADASRYRSRTDVAQRALTTERSRFPSSKEAHTAAFLLGRLADDQSHDATAAVRWYDRYLSESSTGPFASDALGRKMIAVERTQGADAARPIAEQYARRFPHGAYAAQAEELRTR